jgi:hypothetical protein
LSTGILCSFIGTQHHGRIRPAGHLAHRAGIGRGLPGGAAAGHRGLQPAADGAWWKAPFVSTLASSTLDTCIFFPTAFSAALTVLEPATTCRLGHRRNAASGPWPRAAVLGLAGRGGLEVKIALALIALVPFRIVVGKLVAKVA